MSQWTHSICWKCWKDRNPDRDPLRSLERGTLPCCFCGKEHASGIFVRAQPLLVLCQGKGTYHEEEDESMPPDDRLISACLRVLQTHGLAQSGEEETKWSGLPQQQQALAILHRRLDELFPRLPDQQPMEDEIVVTDFVSARTRKGMVELRVNADAAQMDITEATKIGLDLLNACAAAEQDAAFLSFFMEHLEMPEEQAGKIFAEFRNWRLAQETLEDTNAA